MLRQATDEGVYVDVILSFYIALIDLLYLLFRFAFLLFALILIFLLASCVCMCVVFTVDV